MSRRRTRMNESRLEALVRAVGGLLLLAALAIGGISGFSQALLGLVALIAIGLLCALALAGVWLTVQSRLSASQKLGTCVIIAGITLAGLSFFFRPGSREQWSPLQATVARDTTVGDYTTETTYRYTLSGRTQQAWPKSRTQHWTTEQEATSYAPSGWRLFVNPSAPSETSESPRSGWVPVTASPIASRVIAPPSRSRTLRLMITAPELWAKNWAVEVPVNLGPQLKTGTKIEIWVKNSDRNQIRFARPEEPSTSGRNSMGWLGLTIAIVGSIVIFVNRRARASDEPASGGTTQAQPLNITPNAARHPTIHDPVADVGAYRSTPPAPIVPLATREQLDLIDWYQFEKFCAALLRASGFEVERKGGAHPDGGVDLIASRGDERLLVQCKHWRTWMLQEKTAREMLGAMTHFGVHKGAIYTLKGWTKPAALFAQQHSIELADGDELARRAERHLDAHALQDILSTREHHCPKCESVMIWREGNFEPFWGCSRYPFCRGKLNHSGAR